MEIVSVGDYIEQIRGISYKPNEISNKPLDDYLPVLRATNFDETGFKLTELNYIHKSRIKKEQLIQAGDILIAASSGSKDIVGKNIQFRKSLNGSFGAFCKLVRVKKDFSKEFIGHFFKTPYYRNIIRNSIQGANISNLKNEHINDLKIAKPPLEDQIRIANILSKAEALISQRKESLRLLDELLKSTFLEMFGDPVRNEKGWGVDLLQKYSTKISSGSTPLGGKEVYQREGKYFIRSQNIRMNFIDYSDAYCISDEIHNKMTRTWIKREDVLLNITGASIGRVATYHGEDDQANVNQHVCIIRTLKNKLNPRFLEYLIANDHFQQVSIGSSSGGTREAFTFEMIKNFKVILPPLKLQTQFAHIVEKTEALKAHYQTSLQELENLYGSLSQLAFKGELNSRGEGATYAEASEDTLAMAAEPDVKYQNK